MITIINKVTIIIETKMFFFVSIDCVDEMIRIKDDVHLLLFVDFDVVFVNDGVIVCGGFIRGVVVSFYSLLCYGFWSKNNEVIFRLWIRSL